MSVVGASSHAARGEPSARCHVVPPVAECRRAAKSRSAGGQTCPDQSVLVLQRSNSLQQLSKVHAVAQNSQRVWVPRREMFNVSDLGVSRRY